MDKLDKKYAYLKIMAGDYIQTKEPVKGKVVRVIDTGHTDQWDMALNHAKIVIAEGQTIIVPLRSLEKQRV